LLALRTTLQEGCAFRAGHISGATETLVAVDKRCPRANTDSTMSASTHRQLLQLVLDFVAVGPLVELNVGKLAWDVVLQNLQQPAGP
jgi:hypothetical protein